MVVFAGPKLFKHTMWMGGGLCVRVSVHVVGECMRHRVACEHTTHLLKARTCQGMPAPAKSDT